MPKYKMHYHPDNALQTKTEKELSTSSQ